MRPMKTYSPDTDETILEIARVFQLIKSETAASDISCAALTEIYFKIKYGKSYGPFQ